MASPLINCVALDWFEQGNGAEVPAAVSEECQWCSQIIRTLLANHGVRTQPPGRQPDAGRLRPGAAGRGDALEHCEAGKTTP